MTIRHVDELSPGDIIAFAVKTEKITKTGQHVMIVSDNPKPSSEKNCFDLNVFDSTSGHCESDIRGEEGGIGEGTICLETSDAGSPRGLKWSKESTETMRPSIAMGRVKDNC